MKHAACSHEGDATAEVDCRVYLPRVLVESYARNTKLSGGRVNLYAIREGRVKGVSCRWDAGANHRWRRQVSPEAWREKNLLKMYTLSVVSRNGELASNTFSSILVLHPSCRWVKKKNSNFSPNYNYRYYYYLKVRMRRRGARFIFFFRVPHKGLNFRRKVWRFKRLFERKKNINRTNPLIDTSSTALLCTRLRFERDPCFRLKFRALLCDGGGV